jgi:hypothetical protein
VWSSTNLSGFNLLLLTNVGLGSNLSMVIKSTVLLGE